MATREDDSFRVLFDASLDPIVVIDERGYLVDANEAITQLGVARRLIPIGQHVRVFFPPDDAAEHERAIAAAVRGDPQHYEARIRTLDGRTARAAISATPVPSGGALLILRDVDRERETARRLRERERELAQTQRHLDVLATNVPDALLVTDANGIVRDCNDAAVRVLGRSAGELINRGIDRVLVLGESAGLASVLGRAAAGDVFSIAASTVGALEERREFDVTVIPEREFAAVSRIYFVAHDVTERLATDRRAEAAASSLRDLYFIAASADYSDERMAAMLALGCTSFDAEAGAVIDCTGEPFVQTLHQRPGSGPTASRLLIDIAQVAMDDARGAVARHPNGWGVKLMVNGEPFGAIVFASKLPSKEVVSKDAADLLGLMATLLANSIERRRVRAHLRQIAYYDALTGLPNRAFAQERLRDAIDVSSAQRTRVAVLCLDVDHFREVNETLGHERGDDLLRAISARLGRELGPRGTVARLGGDTFLLIVPNCRNEDQAHDLAERMLSAIGQPFSVDDGEYYLSTSIGVAIFPDHGLDDQALIKNADIAMYRAKDRGRGTCFFYDPALEAPIRLRVSQERLLRQALERNEFEVYYQPQIDVRTGCVVCVEALVRWNHPQSGLVEPAHFIPSAELSGLIVPLGDWVLETAARQVARWQAALGPLRLAVNLSGRQFHQRNLLGRIFASLNGVHLSPHLLEVEITESIAMSDAEGTATLLSELKRSGVRTALDDFGTGYSSLGYLRRFEFDVLKVDRTFTAGIGTSSSDETIVRTVIAMAHSLGLEVVAEGVENAAQLAFLREQGCEIVQGHVLAPAIPVADLERLLLALRTGTPEGVR